LLLFAVKLIYKMKDFKELIDLL